MKHWQGEYAFGDTWLAFHGTSAENQLHAHAAVQIIVGKDIQVADENGASQTGDGFFIHSGVQHAIHATHPLTLLLIEPEYHLTHVLKGAHQQKQICPLNEKVHIQVLNALTLSLVVEQLSSSFAPLMCNIDRRLARALAYLRSVQQLPSMDDISAHAGISQSRLRALSQKSFAVPFSKILLWKKVSLACIAMANGHSLADAAILAGFTDQAHLTRTMQNVMGLTPGQARQIKK